MTDEELRLHDKVFQLKQSMESAEVAASYAQHSETLLRERLVELVTMMEEVPAGALSYDDLLERVNTMEHLLRIALGTDRHEIPSSRPPPRPRQGRAHASHRDPQAPVQALPERASSSK